MEVLDVPQASDVEFRPRLEVQLSATAVNCSEVAPPHPPDPLRRVELFDSQATANLA
jgi:hypothetical protein